MGRAGWTAFGFGVLMMVPRTASADALSEAEIARLGRGETVIRPETLTLDGRRYVGGVTYTVLESSGEQLLAIVEDESAYREVMPRAKFVQRIPSRDAAILMEVHHGNALVDAGYTMRLEKEPDKGRIRFWVDLARPHDVEDACGFFRYVALPPRAGTPRVLLTYAVLVDLGNGVMRSLYEDRVKGAMFTVPQLLRSHLERQKPR